MKIGKPAESQAADALSRTGNAPSNAVAGHSRSTAVDKTAPVDAVHLSPASRNLAAEGAQAGQSVRAQKVEDVKAAIREGRFQVNAHAVADKMIAQAAELLEALSRPK